MTRAMDGLRSLLLYPLVSLALWVALLWPWRRELPGPLLRGLCASSQESVLRTTRLRLRIWRLRVRVQPFAAARHPALFPLLAPFANARRRRRSADGGGLSTWCASLLPALRFAPTSRVALAHAWHRPERAREAGTFLDAWTRNDALQMLWCLQERDGRWHDVHFDKREFFRRCETAGLPTIPVLAVFHRGRCEAVAEGGTAGHAELFSKAVATAAGRRAEAWSRQSESDVFRSSRGEAFDERALFAHLEALSIRHGDFLLQPRLRNHPEVAALTGSQALCCLRVISALAPDGAFSLVPGWSVLKVAPPDAIVDNVAGGDSTRYVVDLDSGVLRTRSGELVRSGGAAEPAIVPFWKDVVALCRRAHEGPFARLAAVAWDVAVTAEGPVLVEGNLTFMGPGTESTTGPYCGRGPLVDVLLAHLERVGGADVRRLRRGWRAGRRGRRESDPGA